MRDIFTIISFIMLLNINSWAQIEFVDNCEDIVEVHELISLDGFNDSMEIGNGQPSNMTFCNGQGDIDNPHWFAFTVDPYFEYSFEVVFYNCTTVPLGLVGGQLVIYESCPTEGESIFCVLEGTTEPIVITDHIPLESGVTYYVLLDGFAESICDIEINVDRHLPMETTTDWYYSASGFGGSSMYWYSDVGDTIINGLSYRMIQSSPDPSTPYNRYIRETTDRKVFEYNSFNNEEDLLYDFDANLGSIVTNSYGSFTVTEIDFVDSPYGELQRWKLDGPGPPIYVIDGIGSDDLFLANTASDPIYSLLCAYHESDKLYGNETCSPHPRWLTATTELSASICDGDSFVLNGNTYTEQGVYMDTLSTVSGEDSIIILDLTVLSPGIYDIIATYCQGDILFTNGITFDEDNPSGNIVLSEGAANGCDSIIHVELTFLPEITENYETTICEGSTEIWAGQTISAPGDYTFNLTTAFGCDSTINLMVTVMEEIETQVNETLCSGDEYVVDGNILTVSGVYQFDYISSLGCDSLVTYQLDFLPLVEIVDTIYFCPTDTIEAGTYQSIDIGVNGCDSITNITAIELPPTDSECLTSIDDLETFALLLSPNPFDQSIYLGSEETIQSIEVINISGARIDYKDQINGKELKYDGDHLARGVYLIKVKSKDRIAIRRIVKN